MSHKLKLMIIYTISVLICALLIYFSTYNKLLASPIAVLIAIGVGKLLEKLTENKKETE
ncbi:hypothetical protein J5Y03_04920 [Bacillus sp. RG28]|uniref:Uncharacterized protein n=1 Tax=Gottfriedia endophytica TaxID=2820819 RepID=A0A940NI71_9BACI|nr:hypothetical protein [Gottfriedia endophytica]MBP0724527.1 hypothetical protein [Gottfriedia endophytica]